MAKKVTTTYVDDLDGETIAHDTIQFALDGVTYEIDLSEENANRFREQMAKWVGFARRVGGRRSAGRKRFQDGPAASEIREWASANGWQVSDRGRVPAEVREAYEQAHAQEN